MKISHKLLGSFVGISLLTSLVGAVAIAQARPTMIAIADNGSGIPEKVRARIFDPFLGSSRDTLSMGHVVKLCKLNAQKY